MGLFDKLGIGKGKQLIDDDIVREVVTGNFRRGKIDGMKMGEGEGSDVFILSELADPFQAGFVGLLISVVKQFKGDPKIGLVHGPKKNCVVFRAQALRGLAGRGAAIKGWKDMARELAALGYTTAESDSSLFT